MKIKEMSAMKRLLLVILLLSTALAAFAQEEMVLDTPEVRLAGTLLTPAAEGRFPVVLIIAGSGPTDRDGNQLFGKNNSLKLVAESLQDAGFASLRYDKRGVGQSEDSLMREADVRFEDFISDARRWVELLSGDDRFSSVWIAGHSEGSSIGLAAAQENPRVSGMICIAGAGRPMDEVLREQLSSQPPLIRDYAYRVLDTLKSGRMFPDVAPMLASLFRPSVQPFLISRLRYDPQQLIATLKIPILIIQGDTDIQITVEDAERLAAANPSAEKVIVPGMNHVLKHCPSTDKEQQLPVYRNPSLPLSEGFVEALTLFMKGR